MTSFLVIQKSIEDAFLKQREYFEKKARKS